MVPDELQVRAATVVNCNGVCFGKKENYIEIGQRPLQSTIICLFFSFFQEADGDRSGTIDFNEFVRYIRSKGHLFAKVLRGGEEGGGARESERVRARERECVWVEEKERGERDRERVCVGVKRKREGKEIERECVCYVWVCS